MAAAIGSAFGLDGSASGATARYTPPPPATAARSTSGHTDRLRSKGLTEMRLLIGTTGSAAAGGGSVEGSGAARGPDPVRSGSRGDGPGNALGGIEAVAGPLAAGGTECVGADRATGLGLSSV